LVELFTRCLNACDEPNEARIAVVDFLDPLATILTDSIVHLHKHSSGRQFLDRMGNRTELIDVSTDQDAEQAWPDMNENIESQLSSMDLTIKHVYDITIHSKVNLDRQVKNFSQRHALIIEPEEPGTFPNMILPFQQNTNFYGRTEELDKIYQYLSPKADRAYHTYTIYGRRGVGKTEIALQFAYTNPPKFDAVFWIQCETSVAIRQSFTDVAVSLNLPGADRDGHHEENLLAVKDWLKRTSLCAFPLALSLRVLTLEMSGKRWLLIFDNAGES
jgi:hypothetical protein